MAAAAVAASWEDVVVAVASGVVAASLAVAFVVAVAVAVAATFH